MGLLNRKNTFHIFSFGAAIVFDEGSRCLLTTSARDGLSLHMFAPCESQELRPSLRQASAAA